MPTNRVQLQPGLSLPKFLALYGTRQQCQQVLLQARWPGGFRCPRCSSAEHSRHERGQCLLLQCSACRHQASLTAGTVFDASKLPLTIWFLAIHLLTQTKTGMSALQLMRHLGVSYRSAWLLKHKLMQVMFDQERRRKLQALVQIDDVFVGGERIRGHGERIRGQASEFGVRSQIYTHRVADSDRFAACPARFASSSPARCIT